MNDKLTDEQNSEILKSLNKAIDNGPWDKSNFLKMIGKNLIGIRDNFLLLLGASTHEQLKIEAYRAHQLAQRTNQQEIYVSLYASDGANIQNWERIILNLPRQMISRPIYDSEDAVKEIIKTKDNKHNEAYVAIFVNKDDILPMGSDKMLKDRLGNHLLTIKDKTLNLENISRFVHQSGVYEYNKGKLFKI